MQLDEMQAMWAAQGATLARSLAINERLLRETLLRRVQGALTPFIGWQALEIAIGVIVTLAFGAVIARHGGEPRYLVVGGATLGFAGGITGLTVQQVVLAAQLDYAAPVTVIARSLQALARAELRAFKWALLGGTLLWLPILLLAFEAVTGVDGLARVDLGYLLANLALGGAVLGIGLLLSRRYLEREELGPRAGRIVDALAGRSLRRARAQLEELRAFERTP